MKEGSESTRHRGSRAAMRGPATSKSSASNLRRTIERMQTDVGAVQRTPPEIWLSIFEQATFVPHIFDTDIADPIDFPDAPIPFDKSAEDKLKASLVTKLALILVCKFWHDLAMPLLYQAVVARDNHSLRCLRDAIARPERLPTVPRGLRVRRLDLFCWPEHEINLPLDVLIDLLSDLPHIEIFCISPFPLIYPAQHHGQKKPFTADEADTLIRALSHPAHARTLRKCILLRAAILPVRVVVCHDGGRPGTAHPSAGAPHLPICRVRSAARGHGVGTEAFLRVQGACLRTVQLDMRLYRSRSTLDLCLRLFAEHCPNLVHLIFICDSRGALLSSMSTSFLPTVTHLGIHTEQADHPERGLCKYLRGLQELFELQDMGPVPGVIRRLNTSNEEEWACLRGGNAELHGQFASMPVPPNCRLEDAEGRDLMLLLQNYN
ncbi:hypothetical protein EVG20_g10026 [Dentipellis fragilis]|uniref:F-box domain-containing protein n=1 Tax=Dentipellis fragilis TaxID=205917 RepID=A0A4Y9XTP8_9AGAM|nr:hypothetical protein EVG20_g10026 [Dentipellis fragilis]